MWDLVLMLICPQLELMSASLPDVFPYLLQETYYHLKYYKSALLKKKNKDIKEEKQMGKRS